MVNYFSLPVKNLRRRGIRSWLTLLGVVIGITAVVSLISLGSGLKDAVNSQFGVSSTQVITVQASSAAEGFGPPGQAVSEPLTKDDVEEIKLISSVETAIPRHIETLKMEFNDRVDFAAATSIPDNPDDVDEVYDILGLNVEEGRRLGPNDERSVILGSNFGGEGNAFGKEIETGDFVIINEDRFRVVGILEKKGSFIFDNLVAMRDEQLEEIAGYGENVDLIAVKVRNKDDIERAKEDIEELMRRRRNVREGEEDFSVQTPESTLENVNNILNGIQIFIVIIASISIFIGAIGIVNTMTASVTERVKDIGIMKAIGAENKDIFFQFLIEAGLLGFVGGLIGVILGTSIGYLGTSGINSFIGSSSRPNINFFLIAFSLLGSFLIGAISGIVPALKAARQNPVDALRD